MIKKMALMAVLFAVIMFCSCGSDKQVKGQELIENARDAYSKLDSAKVKITNTKTGETEQTFTFKYDEKGVLTYSYYGKSSNSEYAQYNNGVESFTYKDSKVTHNIRGDGEFVRYTRELKHPQADKGLIIFEPAKVKKAQLSTQDGITHITHEYDAKEIGAKLESGEAKSFKAEYFFDSHGKLLYLIETTTAAIGGKSSTYSYKVEITQQNQVDRVENPSPRA